MLGFITIRTIYDYHDLVWTKSQSPRKRPFGKIQIRGLRLYRQKNIQNLQNDSEKSSWTYFQFDKEL